MHIPPFFLADGLAIGAVYGALLNDRATVQRLAPQFAHPPYKAGPVAPVLYIKPRNTFARPGAAIAVPADPGEVRVEATLGLVIGTAARRVAPGDAMRHVAGYLVASDLTLPHDSFYRPTVRERCRDGFCPMTGLLAAPAGFDADAAEIVVEINGRPAHRRSLRTLVRPVARLLADVTEFMTLMPGDVLLVGPGEGSPGARAGDAVRISIPGLGDLTHTLVAEDTVPGASA